jgi:hypothetical protein
LAMIASRSLNEDWIMEIRNKPQTPADPILIEKMILALFLLENLHDSGLDFIFKGGTCLLLLLGTPKRFSIDIDVVLVTDEGLDIALQSIIQHGIFHRFEKVERSGDVPKRHYKFFFQSVIEKRESSILLDVLFDENPYLAYQEIPLETEFVILEGEPSIIKCPVAECLLGDKLTAFAPNSTGILYNSNKELEIIKQLYDIGLLFNEVIDIKLVGETFYKVVSKELVYRGLTTLSTDDVLNDIFETACLIGMRGYGSYDKFTELISGIKRIAGYIYAERFTLDSAILCAAKAAYLSVLIKRGTKEISRFDPNTDLSDWFIDEQRYNKLNKVKKTSPESFYYFHQAIMG